MLFSSLESLIGHTPLVQVNQMHGELLSNLMVKLEGNNPAGSVKDRPAMNMVVQAEKRGDIQPGDTLIEATSGNTGIALAMAAAAKGYRMVLIMPNDMTEERKASMRAYGATLIEVSPEQGMEGARDLALSMQARGEGVVLDQFANVDNFQAHILGTGPEIWRDTAGQITHFVSSMGTTGTITGVGQYLKQQNPDIQIIGVQPQDGSRIPGIRKWSAEYVPSIYDDRWVDDIRLVDQQTAEQTARQLAVKTGILAGISSGGALAVGIALAETCPGSHVVTIACDRGDRYLSSGVF